MRKLSPFARPVKINQYTADRNAKPLELSSQSMYDKILQSIKNAEWDFLRRSKDLKLQVF